MDRIENGVHGIHRSSTETPQKFSDTLRPMGENI